MEISAHDWLLQARQLRAMIGDEIAATREADYRYVYPNFVVMYEFFRLVRGESFRSSRPLGDDVYQSEIRQMEEEILVMLKLVESKLDRTDPYVHYYLEIMRRSFELSPPKG